MDLDSLVSSNIDFQMPFCAPLLYFAPVEITLYWGPGDFCLGLTRYLLEVTGRFLGLGEEWVSERWNVPSLFTEISSAWVSRSLFIFSSSSSFSSQSKAAWISSSRAFQSASMSLNRDSWVCSCFEVMISILDLTAVLGLIIDELRFTCFSGF